MISRNLAYFCKCRRKNLVFVLVVVLCVFIAFTGNAIKKEYAAKQRLVDLRIFSELITNSESVHQANDPDVHFESKSLLRHAHVLNNSTSVAIGLALTSSGVYNTTRSNIRYKFPFFRTLLPSFCKASTQGYSYHFYVAFDNTDVFFTDDGFRWFTGKCYIMFGCVSIFFY